MMELVNTVVPIYFPKKHTFSCLGAYVFFRVCFETTNNLLSHRCVVLLLSFSSEWRQEQGSSRCLLR